MALSFESGITATESSTVTRAKIEGDASYFPDVTEHLSDVHVEHVVLLTTNNAFVFEKTGSDMVVGGDINCLVLCEDRLFGVGTTGAGDLEHLVCKSDDSLDLLQYQPLANNLLVDTGDGSYTFRIASSEERANTDAAVEFLLSKI